MTKWVSIRSLFAVLACVVMAIPTGGAAQTSTGAASEPDLAMAMPIPPEFGDGDWSLSYSFPLTDPGDIVLLIWGDGEVDDAFAEEMETGFRGGFTQGYSAKSDGGAESAGGLHFVIVTMEDAESAARLQAALLDSLDELPANTGEFSRPFYSFGSYYEADIHDRFLLLTVYNPPNDSTDDFPSEEAFDDALDRVGQGTEALLGGLERAMEVAEGGVVGPCQQMLILTMNGHPQYSFFGESILQLNVRVRDGLVVPTDQEASDPAAGLVTEVVNRQMYNTGPSAYYWWESRVLTFGSADEAEAFAGQVDVLPVEDPEFWRMEVSGDAEGPNRERKVKLEFGEYDAGEGFQRVHVQGDQVLVMTMVAMQRVHPDERDSPMPPSPDQAMTRLAEDQLACLEATDTICAPRYGSEYFG